MGRRWWLGSRSIAGNPRRRRRGSSARGRPEAKHSVNHVPATQILCFRALGVDRGNKSCVDEGVLKKGEGFIQLAWHS